MDPFQADDSTRYRRSDVPGARALWWVRIVELALYAAKTIVFLVSPAMLAELALPFAVLTVAIAIATVTLFLPFARYVGGHPPANAARAALAFAVLLLIVVVIRLATRIADPSALNAGLEMLAVAVALARDVAFFRALSLLGSPLGSAFNAVFYGVGVGGHAAMIALRSPIIGLVAVLAVKVPVLVVLRRLLAQPNRRY